MALFAGIMLEHYPELDAGKTLLMCLIHDIGEIYDGDISAALLSDSSQKYQGEHRAAERVFSLLPDRQKKSFMDLWQEYEDGQTPESRLVKALVDENGDTVKEFSTKIVKQTVSKKTAEEMCEIMEYVVDKGGAGTAKVEGYKVGGKTGTANKPKENGGGYSEETYSSFLGMAPMDDPQVAILVIVDNPKGVKYGSQTAAPGAKMILEDTLRYMDLQPQLT
mgnify:CR=1 FL=1